jgi:TolB protein
VGICGFLSPPAFATFSGRPGRIVFERYGAGGDGELFSIRPDGTGKKRLTRNQRGDFYPEWSPDGGKIVYVCRGATGNQSGQRFGDICVTNSNGGNIRAITHEKHGDDTPAWSPSGTKIVFARYFRLSSGGFQADLFKIKQDGSHLHRLTHDRFDEQQPEWSPNGKHILFVTNRRGNSDLALMRPNGNQFRFLTKSSEDETAPCWSADSRQVVYSRYVESSTGVDNPGWEIFKLSMVSRKVRLVTNTGKGSDLSPSWSPDGRRIVFSRGDDLFKMHSDGSDVTRITGNSSTSNYFEATPDWQS